MNKSALRVNPSQGGVVLLSHAAEEIANSPELLNVVLSLMRKLDPNDNWM